MSELALPKWACNSLNTDDLAKARGATTTAERKTAGEIVTVVVRSSAPYRAVYLQVLLLSYLVFHIAWISALSHWDIDLGMEYEIVPVLAALLTSQLLGGCGWVVRMFTPDVDLASHTQMRATVEFHAHHLQKTEGNTGVLIFLSLLEHRAVVIADKGISDKMPQETWDTVVQKVLEGARSGSLGKGLADAIAMTGDILATHFPPKARNENELDDRLIVKD